MFKLCQKPFIWIPSPLQSPNLVLPQFMKSLTNTAKPHHLLSCSFWQWPPGSFLNDQPELKDLRRTLFFNDLHSVTARKKKPWTGNQQPPSGFWAVMLSSLRPIIKSVSEPQFLCLWNGTNTLPTLLHTRHLGLVNHPFPFDKYLLSTFYVSGVCWVRRKMQPLPS